jgi:hypothetical protein
MPGKRTNERMGPAGHMLYVEGANEYKVKRGATAHREGKGPNGKKGRPYRVLLRRFAEISRSYTRVVWCSDAHGNR